MPEYRCIECNFITKLKGDFNRHLRTKKHEKKHPKTPKNTKTHQKTPKNTKNTIFFRELHVFWSLSLRRLASRLGQKVKDREAGNLNLRFLMLRPCVPAK